MPACDSQTLLDLAYANGYARLSDRQLRECLLAAACAGGGGGGGSGNVLFGDPTGATISGGAAYDNAGNLWVDLDPSGAHDWQKVITANAPDPVMAVANRTLPAAPMVVPILEPPQSPEIAQPILTEAKSSRWSRMTKVLNKVTLWFATLLHIS